MSIEGPGLGSRGSALAGRLAVVQHLYDPYLYCVGVPTKDLALRSTHLLRLANAC